MKISSFIALLFSIFFAIQEGHSQEYFVKYGVSDCANCNHYLHLLSKELDGRPVSFLFPKRFESDSSLLVSQQALAKFNYKLVFDDSIYNHLVKGGETYFIAINEGKMFKTKLKDFDLEGVKSVLLSDKKASIHPTEICLIAKNSDDVHRFINDSTLISASKLLNRVTYHSIRDSSFHEIILDTTWTRMAYQSQFGVANYRQKFDKYLEFLKETPSTMNARIAYSLMEDSLLYLYVDVRFWEYIDSVNDDILTTTKMAVFTYDISKKLLINCAVIPPVQENKIYHLHNFGKFIKTKDYFYFFIMEATPTDSTEVLARYIHKDGALIFDELLDFTISKNYIKYKIGNNFGEAVINGDVFSFLLSDKIYDIATKKTYQLPIPEEEYETLDGLVVAAFKSVEDGETYNKNYYTLFHVADKGNAYGVLYSDKNKELISIDFDKETGKILKKQKIAINVSAVWGISFHPQDYNKMIYYNIDDAENCFHIMDL